jgi:hypothetical protein
LVDVILPVSAQYPWAINRKLKCIGSAAGIYPFIVKQTSAILTADDSPIIFEQTYGSPPK